MILVVSIMSVVQLYTGDAQFFYCFRNMLTILYVLKISDFWTAPYTSFPTPISSSALQNDFGVRTFCRHFDWYYAHSPHFPGPFYLHRQWCIRFFHSVWLLHWHQLVRLWYRLFTLLCVLITNVMSGLLCWMVLSVWMRWL